MFSLKDAAAQAIPFVDSVLEYCPFIHHDANVSSKVSIRELQGQMRAIRTHFERRLGE